MPVKNINKSVFSVGVLDKDRKLFDELIPLPEGTSYNSYFIAGSEKNALIDTVYLPKKEEFLVNIESLGLEKLNYIICNHAEPDHSGSIPALLNLYKEAMVVTNARCKDFLVSMVNVPEDKIIVVKDKEILSLGDKTLEFHLTPWVHWPDTMMTYLREDQILFSCDFLGAHIASDALFVEDEAGVYKSAKRYYAEIMMPFRSHIRKYLDKIKNMDVNIIAPSHGQVYSNPQFILDAYSDWASDDVKNEVIIAYVSMYDSTRKMADYLLEKLKNKGLAVKLFNLIEGDIGELAVDLVNAATLIIASPTVLSGAHPAAANGAFLINALMPKLKYAAIIGSYGWGGNMVEQIKGMLPNLKAEFLSPVLIKGCPDAQCFKELEVLAEAIADHCRVAVT